MVKKRVRKLGNRVLNSGLIASQQALCASDEPSQSYDDPGPDPNQLTYGQDWSPQTYEEGAGCAMDYQYAGYPGLMTSNLKYQKWAKLKFTRFELPIVEMVPDSVGAQIISSGANTPEEMIPFIRFNAQRYNNNGSEKAGTFDQRMALIDSFNFFENIILFHQIPIWLRAPNNHGVPWSGTVGSTYRFSTANGSRATWAFPGLQQKSTVTDWRTGNPKRAVDYFCDIVLAICIHYGIKVAEIFNEANTKGFTCNWLAPKRTVDGTNGTNETATGIIVPGTAVNRDYVADCAWMYQVYKELYLKRNAWRDTTDWNGDVVLMLSNFAGGVDVANESFSPVPAVLDALYNVNTSPTENIYHYVDAVGWHPYSAGVSPRRTVADTNKWEQNIEANKVIKTDSVFKQRLINAGVGAIVNGVYVGKKVWTSEMGITTTPDMTDITGWWIDTVNPPTTATDGEGVYVVPQPNGPYAYAYGMIFYVWSRQETTSVFVCFNFEGFGTMGPNVWTADYKNWGIFWNKLDPHGTDGDLHRHPDWTETSPGVPTAAAEKRDKGFVKRFRHFADNTWGSSAIGKNAVP